MNQSERETFHAQQAAGQQNDALLRDAHEKVVAENPVLTRDEVALMDEHARSTEPKFADAILPGQGMRPAEGAEGILASIRPQHSGQGRSDWNSVLPTDVVKVGNVTMTAAIAAKSGLISFSERDGFGSGAPPSPEALAAADVTAKAAEAAKAPVEARSPEMSRVLSNLDEMSGGRGDSIVASVIGRVAAGKDGGSSLAQALGMDPVEAQASVDSVIADGVKSAGDFITKNYPGLDGAAVLQAISINWNVTDRTALALGMHQGRKEAFDRAANYGLKLQRSSASNAKPLPFRR